MLAVASAKHLFELHAIRLRDLKVALLHRPDLGWLVVLLNTLDFPVYSTLLRRFQSL